MGNGSFQPRQDSGLAAQVVVYCGRLLFRRVKRDLPQFEVCQHFDRRLFHLPVIDACLEATEADDLIVNFNASGAHG